MDLEDSFTEKLLSRRKATAAYISSIKAGTPVKSGKKRAALVEEQQISNADSEEVPEESPKRQCVEQPSKSSLETGKENVRMEEDDCEDQFIPFKASSNKGLAALKKRSNQTDGDEAETTGSIAASKKEVNPLPTYVFSTNGIELCGKATRRARFNDLAANINQWEDDLRPTNNNIASSFAKKSSANTSAKPNIQTFNAASAKSNTDSSNAVSTKLNSYSSGAVCAKPSAYSANASADTKGCGGAQSVGSVGETGGGGVKRSNVEAGGKLGGKIDAWNQAVKAALETEENSSPVKKVSKLNVKDSVKSVRDLFPKQDDSTNSNPVVKERVLLSHNAGNAAASKSGILDRSLDPAELPLSARKALFEKSLFGAGSASWGDQPQEQSKLSIAQRAAMFEKAAAASNYKQPTRPIATKKMQSQSSLTRLGYSGRSPAKASPMKNVPAFQASPVKYLPVVHAPVQASPLKSVPVQASPIKSAPIQASPLKSALVQKDVMGSPVTKDLNPSPLKEVSSHVRLIQQQLTEQQRTVTWQDEQRKREVEELANRHQKRQQSSASSHVPSEEEQSDSMHEESEMPEYFEGSCSEMESVYTERESEYDDKSQEESYEEEYQTSNTEEPEVFNPEEKEMSDYVEPEENEHKVQSAERNYRQVEYSNPDSDASSFRSSSVSVSGSCVSKSPSCSSLSSTGSGEVAAAGKADAPLQYTVSFYRRQKQASRTPPLHTIVRREQVPSASDAKEQARAIQEQIKALQEEIQRQQVVIGQTSQALNLCHATAEFSGSTEQVEGERLLLIATHKRQACLNEIQRLKTQGAQSASVSEGMGTLTISDVTLPLKREFLAAQLEGKLNDAVHCFLCLIRYGPQVIVTQMMSTGDKIVDGSLCFTNHIKLQSLPPDFSVVFEVYALQTKKEHLPHDKKYHIRRDQSKMRLTPKGKKADSKHILPTIQSPGGPNTVRSSSFGVVGFTRFIIQNCHKKCFTLDKVPFASPLEGVLKVKLQLHAEHKVTEKGFLTMFEVVTGFGAWHRRWCYLNAQYLAYWKYPYDEQKKDPIGLIDLKKCVTGEVKLVPRDICARPNTFELVTVRPRQKEDKEDATPLIITKHLLCADTKEERILWCSKLNEALANVRKWDLQAMKPVETEQSASVYPSSK